MPIVSQPPITPKVMPVILCGGSGTRLWPLSRSGFPKQFLVLDGNEKRHSLFQQATLRAQGAIPPASLGPTLVVTNEEHRFLALDQLRELKRGNATLLLEPAGRNTAPALTLAALHAMEEGDDPILLITPADQTIAHPDAFDQAIVSALAIAQTGAIAILGITPTAPETGYGYIKVQAKSKSTHGAWVVEQFVEKPNLATATQYLQQNSYHWNGGMFVLKASVWLAALRAFRPAIFEATASAWQGKTSDPSGGGDVVFVRPNAAAFDAVPSESIDYAVIEHCPGSRFAIEMVALNAGWNDLGAWGAVWQVGRPDTNGNVTHGDTVLTNTSDSLVYSSSRLVSAVGVADLVIVETADAVLVADRHHSQDVKAIVTQLQEEGREEKNLHRKVNRPWGWYDSVDEGERFKVKRIQVKPGASLSLQMHHHRAEHWIVVKGVAEVTNGDQVITLHENQSTYIPKGQTHRLANPGTEPLEIIEVQSGDYLGEDDIVRFEDTYGRR